MKNKLLILFLSICLIVSMTSIGFAEEVLEEPSQVETTQVDTAEIKTEEVESQVKQITDEPQIEESTPTAAEEPIVETKTQTTAVKKNKAQTTIKNLMAETPVEKVNVKLLRLTQNGWVVAQSWTAVANGSNNWKNGSEAARKGSPLTIGNTTYTFTNVWKDELGNTYKVDPTYNTRYYGKDFIELFKDSEGPTANLNIYAQYNEVKKIDVKVNYIDNVAHGSGSWANSTNSPFEGYSAFNDNGNRLSTPPDVPAHYTFLYWECDWDGKQYEADSQFSLSKEDIIEDTTINFTAVYEYEPAAKIIYHYKDGIKDTGPLYSPIDIYANAPESLYWFYEDEEEPIEMGTIIDLPAKEITTVKLNIEKQVNVYAHYYTITWLNGDDAELEVDEDVPYGEMPEYNGTTPAKPATNDYVYQFKEWAPELEMVTQDATYIATYNSFAIEHTQIPQPKPDPTPTPDYTPTIGDDSTPITKPFSFVNNPIAVKTSSNNTTIITPAPVPKTVPTGQWALLNLILTIISCLIAILLLFVKKKSENDEYTDEEEQDIRKMKRFKIYSILFGIISIIVFIFTEDMGLPMVIIDKWTILMAIFAIIEIINIFIIKRKAKENEEEEIQE